MSNWLFLAGTPVQVLNSTAIAHRISAGEQASCHLVVRNCFQDAPASLDMALRSGCFKEACLWEHEPSEGVASRMARFLATSLGMQRVDGLPSWASATKFDWFAFSSFPTTTLEMLNMLRARNPEIRSALYEDGSGTFDGNVFRVGNFFDPLPDGVAPIDGGLALRKRLKRLLPRKNLAWNIGRLYVKNPELLRYVSPYEVHRFSLEPVLGLVDAGGATPVFDAPAGWRRRALLLEPPWTRSDGISKEPFEKMMAMLHARGVPFARRSHPCSRETLAMPAGGLDVSDGQWELMCHRNSFENIVLVGLGSSAMLSPVVETGAQPHLVFLHRLYCEPGTSEFARYESFVSVLIDAYGGGTSRIHEPADVDEAVAVIETLCAPADGGFPTPGEPHRR